MFAEKRIEKKKYLVYSVLHPFLKSQFVSSSSTFFHTHANLRQESPDPDAVVNPVAEESFEDVPLAVNFSCVYFVE